MYSQHVFFSPSQPLIPRMWDFVNGAVVIESGNEKSCTGTLGRGSKQHQTRGSAQTAQDNRLDSHGGHFPLTSYSGWEAQYL